MKALKVLQIETTNLCNSSCIFCAHKGIKKRGTMSDELFEKILDDVKEVPTIKDIRPFLNGEPFTDKKIMERLRMINEKLPGRKITFFTNGSLLTKEIVDELVKIENLLMIFSINGACKETRKKLMGLNDYDRVVSVVLDYSNFKKPFRVSMVAHPSMERQELTKFCDLWGSHAMPIAYSNLGGKNYQAKRGKIFCCRAIDQMTVLWDGRVNLCCADMLGETFFGDLNEQSVKEVWESDLRQGYAVAHSQGEIIKGSLCEGCSGA